jgi:hypothetical protein
MKYLIIATIFLSPCALYGMELAKHMREQFESNLYASYPDQKKPGSLYQKFLEYKGQRGIQDLAQSLKSDNTDENRAVALDLIALRLFSWGMMGGYITGQAADLTDIKNVFDLVMKDGVTDEKSIKAMAGAIGVNLAVMKKTKRDASNPEVFNLLKTMFSELGDKYPQAVALAKERYPELN